MVWLYITVTGAGDDGSLFQNTMRDNPDDRVEKINWKDFHQTHPVRFVWNILLIFPLSIRFSLKFTLSNNLRIMKMYNRLYRPYYYYDLSFQYFTNDKPKHFRLC